MIERAETVQVHFTYEGEGLKAQRRLNGVLHGGLWIRFSGLPEFASCPPPRVGLDMNSGRL